MVRAACTEIVLERSGLALSWKPLQDCEYPSVERTLRSFHHEDLGMASALRGAVVAVAAAGTEQVQLVEFSVHERIAGVCRYVYFRSPS